MSGVDKLKKSLEELDEFLKGLTPLDAMNFKTLISLPNSSGVIEKMPDGRYRRMAILALAIAQTQPNQE